MNKFILLSLCALPHLTVGQNVGTFPPITGAELVDADQFIVRDVSVPTLKRISRAELKLGLLTGYALTVDVNAAIAAIDLSGYATTVSLTSGLATKQNTLTLGTGIATALAINTGSAGAPVLLNGALGTPTSGVATNLTGTATGLTAGNATLAAGLSLSGGGTVTGASGAITATASGTNQNITLAPSGTGSVVVPAGTASTPSIHFGDATTGIYKNATDRIGFTTGGVNKVVVYSSGMFMASGSFGINTANWFRIGAGGVELTTTATGGTYAPLYLSNLVASGTLAVTGASTLGTVASSGLQISSNLGLGWVTGSTLSLRDTANIVVSSTSAHTGTADTNLSRISSGLWGVGTGAQGSSAGGLKMTKLILTPAASVTPASNGDLEFELTSNTSLTIKAKGSDGTVRSVVLTLAP